METMTTKTLILMRHAKSSWSDESMDDHDRPLNNRGRKAVPLMARWFLDNDLVPYSTLCSTAKRTQQTALLLSKSELNIGTLESIQELYLATPSTILKIIEQHAPRLANTLLVIGHNPGMENLASILAGKLVIMPTAAVAVFRVTGLEDWKIPFDRGQTELADFVTPRSIDATADAD
jgi:phosphohistidine phosphatase